jgi:hypothetical protein
MSKTFKQGEPLVPQERDPNVFTKADTLTMSHTPAPVFNLPKPDSVSLDGEKPAASE